MAKRREFSEEEKKMIAEARKKNQKKGAERRLRALQLYAEGKSEEKIGEMTGYHPKHIGVIVRKFDMGGVEAVAGNHYKGNRRNMSFEEEEELLKPFFEEAAKGRIVNVAEIEEAYRKAVSHSISNGQIYRVLKRHEWRKVMPRGRHPDQASEEEREDSKEKLNMKFHELRRSTSRNVRVTFHDEAGFGRINRPRYCWCKKGIRPSVPCHYIRQYCYAYGAVEPLTGESFFLILPSCDTVCMNLFLERLSKAYADDAILLCCDNAAWHKSKGLKIPENIVLFYLPPCTPEMNPIEQIWKELRGRGFRNEIFSTLDDVVQRLCKVILSLSKQTVRSITARNWIIQCFI